MWPGSVHDAKVFANSNLVKMLQENTLLKLFNHLLLGREKIPNYLIGDPAYPLTAYCIKEFESCLSSEEVVFNNLLRAARNPIECVYGRLKACWRILTRPIDFKLEVIPTIVPACFTLHNICELKNSYFDEELVQSQVMNNREESNKYRDIPDPIYSGTTNEGKNIRDTLTMYVKHNLPDNY